MPNTNASVLSTVLGTTLVVGTLSSLGWYFYFTSAAKSKDDDTDSRQRSTLSSNVAPSDSSKSLLIIRPPFPPTIRNMLSTCRLAYLSTVDKQFASSHLSLMRFTYLHDDLDGEVVIMSTNRKTKKFEMLRQQTGVALLVHDFDQAQLGSNGALGAKSRSITLNGECRILYGVDEEKYRKAHLKHNPDYPQFIVGKDIAILCINVSSARICDLNDKVTHWNVLETVEGATS
mmetsp:Transcript_452/g.589  ORF Transcript_452/g.589 Transcript_452/m.589 type:complete len:231 (-) Transcript_452:702-1394(-)